MPSWQARLFNAMTRRMIRRHDWGRDDMALARRTRRLFGAPAPYIWLAARGLRVEAVRNASVRGEWLLPHGVRTAAHDPVMMYVHGGGYVSCSHRTHRPIAAALARRTGHRVLSIDYRLAPEHRYPAAIDDVVSAYRWLLATGVSADRVAVTGDSAGGGLVLALVQRVRRDGLPRPACMVCFSPLADLEAQGDSVRANAGRDHMFWPENTPAFARAYAGPGPHRAPELSMVHADPTGWPPGLFQVSRTELLLDDARRVHERMRAAGCASTLTVYDDLLHCWQMLVGIVPEAGAALDEAAAFIARHVAAPQRASVGAA